MTVAIKFTMIQDVAELFVLVLLDIPTMFRIIVTIFVVARNLVFVIDIRMATVGKENDK